MPMKVILPPALKSKYEDWHFSPAIACQGFVIVSGCTGKRLDGTISEYPEEQFRQSFLTIKMSLDEAGLTWRDVIDLTSYHVGLKKHLDTFMKVKDEFLKEPYPTWTAMGVSELAVEGAIIEIKVVAFTGN